MTTELITTTDRESRSAGSEDITLLMNMAIANGQRELNLNAQRGRRLSPRDDAELAMRRDPTNRTLPQRARDEVFRVLVRYEFQQLHGDRFHDQRSR